MTTADEKTSYGSVVLTAGEPEYVGEGKAMRPTNYVIVPIWFSALLVPFVIASLYIPIKDGGSRDPMPAAVVYVYVEVVGQSYRLLAGGLNLYAYFAGKPLIPILGEQPSPDLDVVFPFFLDFTVGLSSIIWAICFKGHPLLWGALLLWVAYGWMDHLFAGFRLYFCKRFGPYPRVFLGKLGFEIFVMTSALWQGSALAVLLLSKDAHAYFKVVY